MSEQTKANGNRGQRRMPVKTQTFELTGDFEGWTITSRTNPPLGPYADELRIVSKMTEDDPLSVADGVASMVRLLKAITISWNFVDESGKDLPLTDEGFAQLPFELLSEAFNAITKEISQAPLVSSET